MLWYDDTMWRDRLRKAILVLIAAALFGAGCVTSAPAASIGGFVGGYPASFGSDSTEGRGGCRLVAHRVMTRHGWQIRRVRVCN
jgi:hypothetical protein